jgi:hypothetical protein
MEINWVWYLSPFLPTVTRGFMSQWFRSLMFEELEESEKDRDTHRSVIIPMAGFSFTALLALVVAEAGLQLEFQLSIYFLFLSFLGYFVSLNLQSYKSCRWHDLVSITLIETASFSLILAIINIIMTKMHGDMYFNLSLVAIVVWIMDHSIRYFLLWRYLLEKERANGKR